MKKYNVVVSTDIGSFIFNKNDLGVGWQLSQYGTYDPNELQAVKELLRVLRNFKPNLVVLDIGANIGVHSIALSESVGPNGLIYAFEAQRIVFNMLAGNIALNSLSNILCFHNAVTDKPGFIDIPIFDYGKPLSIGSIEFGGAQIENIGQKPLDGVAEKVPAVLIDSLNLNQLDFMKIDVEGMEINALRGAAHTIAKCRPLILLEFLKSDKKILVEWLKNADYIIYSGIGANFLCIPKETGLTIDDLALVN
jgi:FkbM family methyltransferase